VKVYPQTSRADLLSFKDMHEERREVGGARWISSISTPTLHKGEHKGNIARLLQNPRSSRSHSSPCNMCKLHDDFNFNSQFPFSPANIAPASQQFPPPNPPNISVSLGVCVVTYFHSPFLQTTRRENAHARAPSSLMGIISVNQHECRPQIPS
jgi:hypothetical protein